MRRLSLVTASVVGLLTTPAFADAIGITIFNLPSDIGTDCTTGKGTGRCHEVTIDGVTCRLKNGTNIPPYCNYQITYGAAGSWADPNGYYEFYTHDSNSQCSMVCENPKARAKAKR